MKFAVLKPKMNGKKLVFNIETPLETKSLAQVDNIEEKLIKFGYQRYIIRKSRESNKSDLSKRFR